MTLRNRNLRRDSRFASAFATFVGLWALLMAILALSTTPRVDAGPLHGTGCVLSSAIACRLALGAPLVEAVRAAKDYLGAKLAAPLAVGRGARTLV